MIRIITINQLIKYLIRLEKIKSKKFSILIYNIRIKNYIILNKNYKMLN